MFINKHEFDVTKGYIMGILNVTPDSFSDGGKYCKMDEALYRAEEMIEEGAAILDVGGESTRPGYTEVPEQEEIERIVPVIQAIRDRFDIPVSADTCKAKTAAAAAEAGAGMINDIWGLRKDPDMADVIAKKELVCCLMHNRNKEKDPYVNLIDDIKTDLQTSLKLAEKAGIQKEKVILDPGIGFGKNTGENLKVLQRLGDFRELGYPFLLGTSRKSVIGNTLGLPVNERLEGTIATTVLGVMEGYMFFRVHDIRANYRAMKMAEAIREVR